HSRKSRHRIQAAASDDANLRRLQVARSCPGRAPPHAGPICILVIAQLKYIVLRRRYPPHPAGRAPPSLPPPTIATAPARAPDRAQQLPCHSHPCPPSAAARSIEHSQHCSVVSAPVP